MVLWVMLLYFTCITGCIDWLYRQETHESACLDFIVKRWSRKRDTVVTVIGKNHVCYPMYIDECFVWNEFRRDTPYGRSGDGSIEKKWQHFSCGL